MQLFELLAVLRRRWLYLALGTLVGLAAGLITAPGASNESDLYQATHKLLIDGTTVSGQALNLEQTVLLVSNGAVPERVDKALEAAGQPPTIRASADADSELRSLDITAISTTPAAAAAAADRFAEELNAELQGIAQSGLDESLRAAQDRLAPLQEDLAEVEGRLAPMAPEDPARAGLEGLRASLQSAIAQAQTEVQQFESASSGVNPPLRTLEAASGRPIEVDGWRIPESKPVRGSMLALFGIVLGVFGAIAAHRLDTRVRDKDDAERAFDLPVVAEIPPLPSGTKGRELLVATRPAAPFVEACRALRTVVLFAADSAAEQSTSGNGTNGHHPSPPVQVILVTSPSAGEGKTTTTAHLAATLAEFGKRVLVVSADFRRPRIHELFDVRREPGLSDVLESGTGRVQLSDLQMATSFKGVHLLPSGGPVNNPAQLLTETAQLISAARHLFDFVLIDTPPLLVANDATELAAVADMVILMAKADRTSRDAARRSTEILRRVDAPLLGVVIASAHDTPTAYGYYRYRYYAEADQSSGRRGNRSKKEAQPKPERLASVGLDRSDEI